MAVFDNVVYLGTIDGDFRHDLGALSYRALDFARFDADCDFQSAR